MTMTKTTSPTPYQPPSGSTGRRSVAGILEGIQEIQRALMVDYARLTAESDERSRSATIVKQQVEVLQAVLDAPFSQAGQQHEDTGDQP